MAIKVLLWVNTHDLSTATSNKDLPDPLYKMLKWKDGGIEYEHPIMSVLSKYWKAVPNNYPVEMTAGEKAVVNSAEFQLAKAQKKGEIDANTRRLVEQGFNYDSMCFNFTSEDQLYYLQLSIEADKGNLSYPVVIGNASDANYSIASKNDYMTFYEAGVTHRKGYKDSGQALKVQVNAASNQSQLDAIVDNRT